MAVKELFEARWKAIICGLIALVLVEVSTATYGLFKSALNTSNMQQLPQVLQQQLQQMTGSLTSMYGEIGLPRMARRLWSSWQSS